MSEITKTCPGAEDQGAHTLPASAFSGDRTRRDGKAPYCKACAAAKQRAWKRANADKVRASKQRYRARGDEPSLA